MTSTYSLKNAPRRMAEDGERDASRYEKSYSCLQPAGGANR